MTPVYGTGSPLSCSTGWNVMLAKVSGIHSQWLTLALFLSLCGSSGDWTTVLLAGWQEGRGLPSLTHVQEAISLSPLSLSLFP